VLGAGMGVQSAHRATSPLLRSDFAQSTAGRRRTATSRTVSSPQLERELNHMRFDIYEDNDGRYHWSLIGEDDLRVAVSPTGFASATAARHAAAAVHSGAGSATGAED
jgi:uncharacterized protein YegP (UPF0339 family)